MAPAHLRSAVHRVRRTVLPPDAPATSDGQFLESFIERNDGGAFEALVRRHGPMVLGVCRRVARNHHDAEDAFQATFLVLARRATSVNPREQLPNWLYGVAFRTASKARALAARRRAREARAVPGRAAEEVPPVERDDLRSVIDRELNALPAAYRLALLVCDLEGASVRDAALRLGWPQGTLAGRLARGRKLLARRLAGRGVLTPAGVVATALTADAVAAAGPVARLASTLTAALFSAAPRAATGAISPAAAELTERVMMTAFWHRMKAAAALLVLGVTGLTGGALSRLPTAAAVPPHPEAVAPAARQPVAGTATLAFEVRVLTVTEGTRFGPEKEGGVAYLTQAQLAAALERLQGDSRVNVLAAPRVVSPEGRPAVVTVGGVENFVTGVRALRVNGQAVLAPVTTQVETGVTLTLSGRASADRGSVTVSANYSDTRVGKVELVPVAPAAGPPAAPVQCVQLPHFEKTVIENSNLKLSEGRHGVIAGPTSVQESRDPRVPEALWDAPVVGELVRAFGTRKVPVRTYLIVSARVAAPVEAAPMPRSK